MASAPIQQTKACTKCGEVKPLTADFFVRKLSGYAARCKPCLHEDKRAAWSANAPSINAARRAARCDETRAAERERYNANPERKRKNVAEWRARNPDKRKEIDRKHYQKFAEKRRKQAAEWAAANPDRKRENMREWIKRRRAVDPMFRLRNAISAYLNWCLRNGKRGRRVEEILGYTISELKAHLERQFTRGMSWANYGEWHVDHIIPVSSFCFESEYDADFKACWALPNLRPLWGAENIKKSNKRLFLL